MHDSKKERIQNLISDSTKLEVFGTSRFTETRVLFTEVLPAVTALRNKYPQAGATKIAARITKIMVDNGYPKFKLNAASLSKWYKEATDEDFCIDPVARARGIKLRETQLANRAKKAKLSGSPIFPNEPEPKTAPQVAAEPIGLDQVAKMDENEFIVNDDDELAQAPDPFGG